MVLAKQEVRTTVSPGVGDASQGSLFQSSNPLGAAQIHPQGKTQDLR